MGAARFGLVEQFTELEWNVLTSTAKPNVQGWTTTEMCNFLTHGYGYRATECLQSISQSNCMFHALIFCDTSGEYLQFKTASILFFIGEGKSHKVWWRLNDQCLTAGRHPLKAFLHLCKLLCYIWQHLETWQRLMMLMKWEKNWLYKLVGHRVPKAQMLISWYTDHIHFDLDGVQKYYNVF